MLPIRPSLSGIDSGVYHPGVCVVPQVRFLDSEVAYWQTVTQHYMVNGSSTNPPSAANVHALDGTR